MTEILSFGSQDYRLFLMIFGVISYVIYKWTLGYAVVNMKGNYDPRNKNIGRTLPPFPNGWYLVCKSKELLKNQTKSIDIAGQNIVLTRDKDGKVNALYAYCAHMGANLGLGGKVINGNCLECPFHGWLYNTETGQLVNHDNKPISAKSLEYDKDFASGKSQTSSWVQGRDTPTLRKYPVKEANIFIYVWIHTDPKVQPNYQMIDATEFCKGYANRGQTIHEINCHLQDIPENGADTFHFKYVHRYLIKKYKLLEVTWKPKWKRGDDPNLPEIFEHPSKGVRTFKQRIYNELVKPLSNKQYYSVGTVDSYVHLPLLGPTFFFNITIVQMGPSLVNVFLKTNFFELVFFQYIQPQGKYQQKLYHEMFCSTWIPHWLCWTLLYAEGMQVFYDMLIWDAKKFAHKVYLKDNQADRFIKSWREWFSQHYEGCSQQLTTGSQTMEW